MRTDASSCIAFAFSAVTGSGADGNGSLGVLELAQAAQIFSPGVPGLSELIRRDPVLKAHRLSRCGHVGSISHNAFSETSTDERDGRNTHLRSQHHVLRDLHHEIVAVPDAKSVGDREAGPGVFLTKLPELLPDRRCADLLRVVAVRVLPGALA